MRGSQFRNAIDAAVQAGVGHVFLFSAVGTHEEADPSLGAAYWTGEQHLVYMCREGELQVVEHPGIGEIAQAHADARQDRDDAQDFYSGEDFPEIGGIAERRERLAHLIRHRQVWRFCSMAKIVFGMNQSLDGYVDHEAFAPDPVLFRHWIEHVRGLTGSVYGRRMYEVMRYFDEDDPEWDAERRDFAAAWRRQPKWVVSRSLKSVGPNATLVENELEAVIRGLKAQLVGEIAVSGPDLARSLTDLGLIDEYRLYFHPVVLGRGKPFFAGPRPPLRLVASDRIGEDAIRLTYVPA